jgi:hypothetical protein
MVKVPSGASHHGSPLSGALIECTPLGMHPLGAYILGTLECNRTNWAQSCELRQVKCTWDIWDNQDEWMKFPLDNLRWIGCQSTTGALTHGRM